MLTVTKGAAPSCLTRLRATPGAVYENLGGDCKQAVREALANEQRGLCCYCMKSIDPREVDGFNVEHWSAQDGTRENDLGWGNLFGACAGGEGGPELHCDSGKGDRPLSTPPTAPGLEQRISYARDGTIQAEGALHDDLTAKEKLNLNCSHLKSARAKAWSAFKVEGHRRAMSWSRDALEREIHRLTEAARAFEYVGVHLYHLRKKLRTRPVQGG